MARQVNTITMLETRAGCPDGIHAQFFEAGKTYSTTPMLTKMFLHNGWAVLSSEVVEEKMLATSIENKSAAPVVDTKEDTIGDRDDAAKKAKGVRRP